MGEAVFERGPARGFLAAALAVSLLVALDPAPGQANPDGGNDRNEQRDTQSRNEQATLDSIPLRTDTGFFYIERVVIIQSRYIHATDSFNKNLGIDYDNLDRVDVSEIPLLGNLFESPLRGEDLTEENRVGSVYRGADGTLVAVVDDVVKVADSEVSVVNGRGRYRFNMIPQLIQIDPVELGEIGGLRSVQTLVRGDAPRDTTIVLGGLTQTSAPETESKVPVLGDIPVLRSNLLGGAYEIEDAELVILIRPTIIMGDEVE
jgi:hypothetical protein